MVTTRTIQLSCELGSKFHSEMTFLRCRDLMQTKIKSRNSASRAFAADRLCVDCASINFFPMGVKSDKTFEEIVERLVALFRPQDNNGPDMPDAPLPSPQTAGPPSAPPFSPASSEEDT